MDYKTNILTKELEVKEQILPEMKGLYFGMLSHDMMVFDYTAYIEENQLDNVDYKVFMRLNRHYIESLSKLTGTGTSNMFYQNTNGHILVADTLAFLFLMFINPEMLEYFTSLLAEAMSEGVVYTHGYIYTQAAQKLPTDILQSIIKERENAKS